MGASLTDSLAVALRFARNKSEERASSVGWNVDGGYAIEKYCPSEALQWSLFGNHGGGGGYIAFDRDLLAQHYKLEENDALGDGSEFETRLLGSNNFGIIRCIDHVVVPNQALFAEYAQALHAVDPSFQRAIRTIVDLIEEPSDDLYLMMRQIEIGKGFQEASPADAAADGEHAIPAFAPRIFTEHGAEWYDDGRVFGAVDTGLFDGSRTICISEWSSNFPGNGFTTQALEWMRGQGFEHITANGVGMIEDGVGDIATAYWEHMHSLKLVDTLLDDLGADVTPGARRRTASCP